MARTNAIKRNERCFHDLIHFRDELKCEIIRTLAQQDQTNMRC